MSVNCARCHEPIALERLEAVPDATMCVRCLKLTGDVRMRRGRMVYNHKTGGELEVLTIEQLERSEEAQRSVEDCDT